MERYDDLEYVGMRSILSRLLAYQFLLNEIDIAPGVEEHYGTFTIEEINLERLSNALVFGRIGLYGESNKKCLG